VDSSEQPPQSFIIKIWPDEPVQDGAPGTWQGHITHVPGGERRHLRSLDGIAAFIRPYLQAMGVRVGLSLGDRIRHLFRRCP
jgi:hypothetical protein